jgi:hypothetical protein
MKLKHFRTWTLLTFLIALATSSACTYHEDKDRGGIRTSEETTIRHNSDGSNSSERSTQINR